MSKWRPLNQCTYVVPDIHGNLDLLNQFLARVEPLRLQDKIIFLGDYIDRYKEGHLILDKLIELKNKYKEQVICLLGNHEEVLLASCNSIPGVTLSDKQIAEYYKFYFSNGGADTLSGYLERNNLQDKIIASELSTRNITKDLVPKEHINFLQNLQLYHEDDNYIFVHAGCNPACPLNSQHKDTLLWTRKLVTDVVHAMVEGKNLNFAKTIITGHSMTENHKPIMYQQFMMLDCGAPNQLLVVEINSMESFMIYPGRRRMLRYSLEENKFKPKGI